jgi:hypothetical protein
MSIKNPMMMMMVFSKFREEDKIKHLRWSFWITAVALLFFTDLHSLLIAFAIGVIKEVWDHYYGSGFCLYDISANCLGIFLAFLMNYIIIFGMALL